MRRTDRIKLDFARNWKLPGKERLAGWLKRSSSIKAALNNGISWLTGEDIAIHTTADNYIEYSIICNGTYEDEIGKLIRTSLKPGFVALDIGANIGLQSIRMSQSCGDAGRVLSFEPLNYLQNKFNKNISLNNCGNVSLLPFALSDTADERIVTVNPNEWNQGAFSLSHVDTGTSRQQLTVKVGDDLPEIQSLSRLDLIKIDVEGFEFHVLRGLKVSLERYCPRIIFEHDRHYWASNRQSITDCFDFLRTMQYTCYQITPVGCEIINQASEIADGNIFCLPG